MTIEVEPAADPLGRLQVAAAIELVAQGRYPRVAVSGIPDAARIAAALGHEAERRGVQLVLEPTTNGVSLGVMVQRR